MAYRDDRVAMLARADALERALEKAEEKQAQAEAERDALAAESQLLRAALVRAVSGGIVRFRARRRPRQRVGTPVAFMLLATLTFALVAIGVVSSARRSAAPTAAPAVRGQMSRLPPAHPRMADMPSRYHHRGWCGDETSWDRVLRSAGVPLSIDGIELLEP